MNVATLALVPSILGDAQSKILAYWKKHYVSSDDFPPLGYYVEVIESIPRKDNSKNVVSVFYLSPDVVREVPRMPKSLSKTRGSFYEIGAGWIYPDRHQSRLRLILNPKGRTMLRYEFLIPKGG